MMVVGSINDATRQQGSRPATKRPADEPPQKVPAPVQADLVARPPAAAMAVPPGFDEPVRGKGGYPTLLERLRAFIGLVGVAALVGAGLAIVIALTAFIAVQVFSGAF